MIRTEHGLAQCERLAGLGYALACPPELEILGCFSLEGAGLAEPLVRLRRRRHRQREDQSDQHQQNVG